jgi:hypothetical protein
MGLGRSFTTEARTILRAQNGLLVTVTISLSRVAIVRSCIVLSISVVSLWQAAGVGCRDGLQVTSLAVAECRSNVDAWAR